MTKDDIFDLILKGAGIYLCVLSLIQLPNAIDGLLATIMIVSSGFSNLSDEANQLTNTLQLQKLAVSIGAIIRMVIYLLVARNFFRGGSWLNWLLGKKGV